MSHKQPLVLVELDVLDDRLLDPQKGTPWVAFCTPFSALRFLDLDSSETYAGNGVLPFQARSSTHGRVRRAGKTRLDREPGMQRGRTGRA
jgi:hypothetical protein